jgi:hypothetical protein
MGTGNNVAGNIFTVDGQARHFPSASDHFPDKQTNVVPINESMGDPVLAMVDGQPRTQAAP